MKQLNIKLGNGVIMSAPIKLNMTVDEWQRMTAFINGHIQKQK